MPPVVMSFGVFRPETRTNLASRLKFYPGSVGVGMTIVILRASEIVDGKMRIYFCPQGITKTSVEFGNSDLAIFSTGVFNIFTLGMP